MPIPAPCQSQPRSRGPSPVHIASLRALLVLRLVVWERQFEIMFGASHPITAARARCQVKPSVRTVFTQRGASGPADGTTPDALARSSRPLHRHALAAPQRRDVSTAAAAEGSLPLVVSQLLREPRLP